MLISKSFCEKFLKNLAREAKPAREKFRGHRARQNGCVHVTWAWTPHSGRTHFAHPSPRVVGTHKTLTKMWPRKHVHTHKFTQIWSSIRTHIWTHVDAHKLRPHVTTHPHDFWASRHIHALPHLPTLTHKVLRTQTTAGLPRFRQHLGIHELFWAVRHNLGHPQLPTKLDCHTQSWAPNDCWLWSPMLYA